MGCGDMNKYQKALNNIAIPLATSDFISEHKEDFDLLKELVDKATPKKPITKGGRTDYKCPVCGRRVRSGKGSSSFQRDNMCQRCFQVLDWSDE